MKLSTHLLIKILVPVIGMIALWSVGFYFAIINEVNDEVDDALEEFSEDLTRRFLAQEPMPESSNGTNNSYHIERLAEQGVSYTLRYSDEEVWIASKNEMEPARVLRTTFTDSSGAGYRLTVLTPTIEKQDLRESLLLWSALLGLLLILLIWIITVFALRRGLKPFHNLMSWLDNRRLNLTDQPLENPTSIEELDRLNNAVREYDERNRTLFEQQKEFVGNASHEMQTPLAICANHLDLLCDTPLSEAQLGEVAKVQATLQYLSRLNASLLLLTKIESDQFHATEKIDLSVQIQEQLLDLEEIFAHKAIRVESDIQAPFEVEMNHTLAKMATMNLLKNAFVHSPNGGTIRITVSNIGLRICNSGEVALDRQRVFTRFYQSQKREGSTGLGLAITASIARLYGLKATYDFKEGFHEFALMRGC
uniref:sensor histidine kinase n=1 Tax=Alistipes sp. TaxID=1872444 RepID=UPI0040563CC6